MKHSSIICLIVSFLLLFVSCATTGKFNQARFDEALFRGEYDTCADMLERKKESKHKCNDSLSFKENKKLSSSVSRYFYNLQTGHCVS